MQNKFQNLQNRFQSTVQDLNSNIRQQLNKARQGADETDDRQYVKIPIEGAKQLRWYDSADLKLLLQVQLSEKHKLYMANAALREALENSRGGKVTTGVEHLNKQVDRMVEKDASVSEFLVVSAGYEIERLRGLAQSGESPKEEAVVRHESQGLEVLRTAQEAQYHAEAARASAEEKLEKFQKLSCTQQSEIDTLKSEKAAQTLHISKLQARVKVLEEELQNSIQRGKVQEDTSKSYKELSSKLTELSRKNEVLNTAVTTEVEKNKRLEQRLHSSEVSLAKALAEASDLEYITAERDELQAKVAYFEASFSDLKAKHVSDRDLCERLDMTERQLKSTQQELLSTAKVAATIEGDLNKALKDLETMKAEKESEMEKWKKKAAMSCSNDGQNTEDRATWPSMALEELDMAQMRIKALQASNVSNETELSLREKECSNLRNRLQEAETEIQDLRVSQENLKKFSESQINRLETALIVASQKAEELHIRNRKMQGSVVDHMSPASGGVTKGSLESNDTDRIYTKNIVLKYIQCCLQGKMQECEVLLPAIKTVLHVPQGEYDIMRRQLEDAQSLFNWMPDFK